MPTLKYDFDGQLREVQVAAGKRLVNALIDEAQTDQLHACGGNAACTSCRVQFVAGEPQSITQAEKDLLAAKGLTGQAGLRLSCQCLIEHDMELKIISRFAGSNRKDAGKPCAADIVPPPVWVQK